MEGSITALKEKKAWYSVQPRPPRKTAEERAAERAEKEKERAAAKEAAGDGEGGAGKEAKPSKKEKKQPKEFKSCEFFLLVKEGCGWWLVGVCLKDRMLWSDGMCVVISINRLTQTFTITPSFLQPRTTSPRSAPPQ